MPAIKNHTEKIARHTRRAPGRPKLDEDGSHVLTLRVTTQQKKLFDTLGRVEWLRNELDRIQSDLLNKTARLRASKT